jgi:protein xylosyltransferase
MFEEMKKLSEKYPDFIRMSERRFSTIWGGASLLRMLVSCMQELLAMDDWKWDFVLVLV